MSEVFFIEKVLRVNDDDVHEGWEIFKISRDMVVGKVVMTATVIMGSPAYRPNEIRLSSGKSTILAYSWSKSYRTAWSSWKPEDFKDSLWEAFIKHGNFDGNIEEAPEFTFELLEEAFGPIRYLLKKME